jgi:hypothetical protein
MGQVFILIGKKSNYLFHRQVKSLAEPKYQEFQSVASFGQTFL